MKIQFIQNTYDVEGIKVGGEYLIILKDGEPVHHLDGVRDCIEVEFIPDILKPFGIDLEFESIDPDEALIKKVNKYLKKNV